MTLLPATEPHPHQRDATLMAAVARGDLRAFEALYNTHQPKVFRVAWGILLHREDARDVVQEVFIKLHAVAPKWVPRAQVSTWLHKVTVHAALGLKQRLRSFSRTLVTAAPPATPESHVRDSQRAHVLTQGLRALGPRDRALVAMHLEDGMKPQDMAALLGMQPNATRVALHRALERLRSTLSHHGVSVEVDPLERTAEPAVEDA